MKTDIATFAAGCFWGVEEAFRTTPGVVETEVGYTGGQTEDPSYYEVCTGQTGHAEAVRVTYNPQEIGFNALLDIFWWMHNPTSLNKQGPDIGTQYRSAIFYHTPEQKRLAEASRAKLESLKTFDKPIVTQIIPVGPWYPAEEYHQHYIAKGGDAACAI